VLFITLQYSTWITWSFQNPNRLNTHPVLPYRNYKTKTRNCLYQRKPQRLTHRPDDGGSKYLWNDGTFVPDYTAQQTRRHPPSSEIIILWRTKHCASGTLTDIKQTESQRPFGMKVLTHADACVNTTLIICSFVTQAHYQGILGIWRPSSNQQWYCVLIQS
jgi:hypothetical protein